MTEQEQVQVTQEWETFCDGSYFDMWCVRRIGDRTFGQGFYVMSQGEAEALRNLLNTRHTATAEALELLRRARDREHNPFEPDNQTKLYHDLTAAIAKIEEQQP